MQRTRIKFCGITTAAMAVAAARAGADAIGLVFCPESPRFLEAEAARQVAQALPPFVGRVGLFVNAEAGFVRQTMDRVPLELLQFHGDETPQFCAAFGIPYIKAVGVTSAAAVAAADASYSDACALLLDSSVTGARGGTGRQFDWQMVPRAGLQRPLILAGGLNRENVGAAIRATRPWAVDVSSGVEASKGRKDHAKVEAFVAAVRGVKRET